MRYITVSDLLADYFNGSPTELAAALGGDVKRQNVEYWRLHNRVPAQHRPPIERLTRGKVTCERLSRDGAIWSRVPDDSWPHKDGRPCLDVAKAVA
jgi:DNA-binding transcriptional regulator YdaS (Cro superfamily)